MPLNTPLHELTEFSDLIQIVATEKNIVPQLIEKDYWIMQCLYGLTQQEFNFELKGGTSLSKGYGIIKRFSEDIDIRINPENVPFEVFIGKNQIKKDKHIQSRRDYYDWLANEISIEGIISVERDRNYDDEKYYRSGGIRLSYNSQFSTLNGLKEGVLLELGFDDTAPNQAVTISSWAYDKAVTSPVSIQNNQAVGIKCYYPGYTFVEKLQTVSTKFRIQQQTGDVPDNFLRHYYDLAQLLDHKDVINFIGTKEYYDRKAVKFRTGDNQDIATNEAFLFSDKDIREQYKNAFLRTASLYYDEQPNFENIICRIQSSINKL